MLKRVLVGVLVMMVCACGDDDEPNNNGTNNGTSNNGTSNNGTSNNGTSNNGTTNNDDGERLFQFCKLACDVLIQNQCVGYESGSEDLQPLCLERCQILYSEEEAECISNAGDCQGAGECI